MPRPGELGPFDSRPRLRSVEAPVAVVVTTRDRTLAVRNQYELAAGVDGARFEFDGDTVVGRAAASCGGDHSGR